MQKRKFQWLYLESIKRYADEIYKKVSSKENFDQDQITEKLELDLYYFKQALGDILEPFYFILHPVNEQNLTKDD